MKLKTYRTFWVLTILYFISVISTGIIGWNIEQQVFEKDKMLRMLGSSFGYPYVFQSVTWLSSILVFMPGLLIILFVTNEFVYRTHRQNIIDGWSRSEFISVKIMLVFITAFIASIMTFISILITGALAGSSFTFDGIKYLGYFCIQTASYCSFALMLSVLIKRTALVLGVFMLYGYILETIISGYINYHFKIAKPGNYLLLNASDSLIPFPFARNVTKRLLDQPNQTILFVCVVVYLSTFLFISVSKFRRSDL